MILPDVNVQIYAFRSDSSRHRLCKSWLDNVANGDAPFGVSALALAAVVRIVTNPRSFREPNTAQEAFAFSDALLARPRCVQVNPDERHWGIFARLVRDAGVRGPAVTDAWYAALAIEHGCTFITFDRDFARFPGLDCRAPA